MEDGVLLVNLIELLTESKINHHENARFRYHKLENVTVALQFLEKSLGFSMIGVNAGDVVDGNTKAILGLLFQLIQRFPHAKPSPPEDEDEGDDLAQQTSPKMGISRVGRGRASSDFAAPSREAFRRFRASSIEGRDRTSSLDSPLPTLAAPSVPKAPKAPASANTVNKSSTSNTPPPPPPAAKASSSSSTSTSTSAPKPAAPPRPSSTSKSMKKKKSSSPGSRQSQPPKAPDSLPSQAVPVTPTPPLAPPTARASPTPSIPSNSTTEDDSSANPSPLPQSSPLKNPRPPVPSPAEPARAAQAAAAHPAALLSTAYVKASSKRTSSANSRSSSSKKKTSPKKNSSSRKLLISAVPALRAAAAPSPEVPSREAKGKSSKASSPPPLLAPPTPADPADRHAPLNKGRSSPSVMVGGANAGAARAALIRRESSRKPNPFLGANSAAASLRKANSAPNIAIERQGSVRTTSGVAISNGADGFRPRNSATSTPSKETTLVSLIADLSIAEQSYLEELRALLDVYATPLHQKFSPSASSKSKQETGRAIAAEILAALMTVLEGLLYSHNEHAERLTRRIETSGPAGCGEVMLALTDTLNPLYEAFQEAKHDVLALLKPDTASKLRPEGSGGGEPLVKASKDVQVALAGIAKSAPKDTRSFEVLLEAPTSYLTNTMTRLVNLESYAAPTDASLLEMTLTRLRALEASVIASGVKGSGNRRRSSLSAKDHALLMRQASGIRPHLPGAILPKPIGTRRMSAEAFLSASKHGFLKKKGSSGIWKERWFVLMDDTLFYYKAMGGQSTASGVIPVASAKVRLASVPDAKHVFEVVTPRRIFILRAESELDLVSWMEALESAIMTARPPAPKRSVSSPNLTIEKKPPTTASAPAKSSTTPVGGSSGYAKSAESTGPASGLPGKRRAVSSKPGTSSTAPTLAKGPEGTASSRDLVGRRAELYRRLSGRDHRPYSPGSLLGKDSSQGRAGAPPAKVEDNGSGAMIELLSDIPGNDLCADCGIKLVSVTAAKSRPDLPPPSSGMSGAAAAASAASRSASTISSPAHVDLKFGVFLCENCSSSHSAISSLDNDALRIVSGSPFSTAEISMVKELGNIKSNQEFEANLPGDVKPGPGAAQWARNIFVMEKYSKKSYAAKRKFTSSASRYFRRGGKKNKEASVPEGALHPDRALANVSIRLTKPGSPRSPLPKPPVAPVAVGRPIATVSAAWGAERAGSSNVDPGKELSGPLDPSSAAAQALRKMPAEAISHPIREGFLYKSVGSSFLTTWRRRWVVLTDRHLFYYKSRLDQAPAGVIDMLLVNVRLIKKHRRGGKPHSFEVVTPTRIFSFAAEADEDMQDWITAFSDTVSQLAASMIGSPVTGAIKASAGNRHSTGVSPGVMASAIALGTDSGATTEDENGGNSRLGSGISSIRNSQRRRAFPRADGRWASQALSGTSSTDGQDSADRRRQALMDMTKRGGNHICAECEAPNPTWVSTNMGLFVCELCAQAHMSVAGDGARLKELSADRWEEEEVDLLSALGNRAVGSVWESAAPEGHVPSSKPRHDSPLEDRVSWVRDKYVRHMFVRPDDIAEGMPGWEEDRNRRLYSAVVAGDLMACYESLVRGANVDWDRNERGETALHRAVADHRVTIVTFFVENGAEPAARDEEGRTPLHLAAGLDDVECAVVLLKIGGADLDVVNHRDDTPMDVAIAAQAADTLELFKEVVEARDAALTGTGVSPVPKTIAVTMPGSDGESKSANLSTSLTHLEDVLREIRSAFGLKRSVGLSVFYSDQDHVTYRVTKETDLGLVFAVASQLRARIES